MLKITEHKIDDYEKVLEAKDEKAGLHAIIAIHNTQLGPALGGIRMYPYNSFDEAMKDALRLSKGMTYKSALAEIGLGGGKAVIIGDPQVDKSKNCLLSFAKFVDTLNGQYITAEDVGTTTNDMVIINQSTPYVSALPTIKSSGDPSPFTAWGTLKGMQAVALRLWHRPSLTNRSIGIQGVGKVGEKLVELLFWEGANIYISDIDEDLTARLSNQYGCTVVSSEDLYSMPLDILAPCALGATINDQSIPLLRCEAIAGSANNQLEKTEDACLLKEYNILYAPDYLINSGGIINAAAEFEKGGYNPLIARKKIARIFESLINIFNHSEAQDISTAQAAKELALHKLHHGIAKRLNPINFYQHSAEPAA
jgi:leucine dehydrogenase